MNKDKIIERLEMLSDLISETQPDIPNDKMLFHHHAIDVLEEIQHIRDLSNKSVTIDQDSERKAIIRLMKKANRYWVIRNRIKGGDDNMELLEVEEHIQEYLDQGSKINAIKLYRESMKTHFNQNVSLRESKDMIDALDSGLKVSLW